MSQRDAEKQGDDDGREAQWRHAVNVGPKVCWTNRFWTCLPRLGSDAILKLSQIVAAFLRNFAHRSRMHFSFLFVFICI